ncbi:hypothetical protein I7I50_03468 [Histoplasma capsulatum G186AR]|uniref:Secreted protein n=1 Tax=Ajellomyces capsulatus TaxID=5037 RepID=A0A8H7YP92_AJECA|nr:hypothetical protein I7I52_04375 [Histoplasma capsulatum]QSS74610.1 hypothetical protein I7I50_03468 [Histoplasma capsulatum G186AR]
MIFGPFYVFFIRVSFILVCFSVQCTNKYKALQLHDREQCLKRDKNLGKEGRHDEIPRSSVVTAKQLQSLIEKLLPAIHFLS